MASIQRDLDEINANQVDNHHHKIDIPATTTTTSPKPDVNQNNPDLTQTTTSSTLNQTHQQQNDCHSRWAPNVPPFGINSKPIGWMDGLLGCMRPVMSLLVKTNATDVNKRIEEWEIPFESITNLEWLGSGAQGTVFSGYLRNEIVAVKKVRDLKETDIKHLRKLDHENIIKFK